MLKPSLKEKFKNFYSFIISHLHDSGMGFWAGGLSDINMQRQRATSISDREYENLNPLIESRTPVR